MATLAVDRDGVTIGSGHHWSGSDQDLADRCFVGHVESEHCLNGRLVHHTFLDHGLCASRREFLGRLEAELHGTAELILAISQQASESHKDCGVAIMTTGVHYTRVLACVLNIVLFQDWQGVHIGPDQHITSGTFRGSLHQASDAGTTDPCADILNPELLEALAHELGGLELLESELRILMQMATIGDDSWQELIHLLSDFGDIGHAVVPLNRWINTKHCPQVSPNWAAYGIENSTSLCRCC